MHQPIPEQGRWLAQVIRGYFAYHAVPTNSSALSAFRYHVTRLWLRTLRRRSQKDNFTWERITKLADDFLPQPQNPSSMAEHSLRRHTPEVGEAMGQRRRSWHHRRSLNRWRLSHYACE